MNSKLYEQNASVWHANTYLSLQNSKVLIGNSSHGEKLPLLENQTLTHMSKSLNNASYDLGSIHALQDKVVMFFNRRKLVFLGSKNIWTSPKRDSKHSLGFYTESSSQGALSPPWLRRDRRRSWDVWNFVVEPSLASTNSNPLDLRRIFFITVERGRK